MFLTGQLYQPQAHNDMLRAFIGSPWSWLFLWFFFMNILTFFVYGVDKWKAKRQASKPNTRRIPERNLLIAAAIGGSLGAYLGMHIWHHKTRHRIFQIGVPLLLILQILLFFILYVWFHFS